MRAHLGWLPVFAWVSVVACADDPKPIGGPPVDPLGGVPRVKPDASTPPVDASIDAAPPTRFCADKDVFFCTDFEDGADASAWTRVLRQGGGQASVVEDRAGSKRARLLLPAAQAPSSGQALFLKSLPLGDRQRILVEAAFSSRPPTYASASAAHSVLYVLLSTGDAVTLSQRNDGLALSVRVDDGAVDAAPSYRTPIDGQPLGVTLSETEAHHIRLDLQVGAAGSGALEVLVDGASVFSAPSLDTRGNAGGSIETAHVALGLENLSADTPAAEMWIDDVICDLP